MPIMCRELMLESESFAATLWGRSEPVALSFEILNYDF